jgi:hypothetical protein
MVVIVAPTTAIANAIEIAASTKRGATRLSVQLIALLSYLGRFALASMESEAHLAQDRRINLNGTNRWTGCLAPRSHLMPGPIPTIADLLLDAADALEDAYKGRQDVPPSTLALVAALRERVEHITAGKPVLDEPEPHAATVTQDEP